MRFHIIKPFNVFEVVDGQVNYLQNSVCQSNLYQMPQKKCNDGRSTSYQTLFAPQTPQNTSQANQSEVFTFRRAQSWISIDNSFQRNQNRQVFSELSPEDYAEQSLIPSQQQSSFYDSESNSQSTSQSNFQNSSEQKISQNSTSETNQRNDSKNVPKGMMKAFAHMVLDKNQNTVRILKRYFDAEGVDFEKYKQCVRKIRKSSKISINQIRDMLLSEQFAVTTRKLGFFFIRTKFISHIFNSKMQKKQIHMRYIHRWHEIFKQPSDFRSLK